jgi:serine/threonine protein kinase
MVTPGDNSKDDLIGRVIAGKFHVLELLGSGAMGKVYKAHHTDLDKGVAVKVLHPTDAKDPSLAARFKAEARAASRLDHPNSVHIFDFGEDGADKLLYITMELLVGQNLGDVLKRLGQLSSLRSLNIMSQVLSALTVAHRSGVVHRDLKPANIMLIKKHDEESDVRDFVKVLDFGIAKILDSGNPDDPTRMLTLTKAGAVFGTPAFMSPEQALGEKIDPRTDIYSCGVILYKMITGKTPYTSETATGLLTKMMTEPPAPMSRYVSTVDPRIEQIVYRAIAKERTQRFQTAAEMRQAIRDVLEGGPYSIDGTIPPPAQQMHRTMPPRSESSPLPRRGFEITGRPHSSGSAPEFVLPNNSIQPLPIATQAPQGPPQLDPTMHLQARVTPAPFQTLAGGTQWGSTGTIRPPPLVQREQRSIGPILIVLVLIAGLIAGGILYSRRSKDLLPGLEDLASTGANGVAETYFLEHFSELEARPEVAPIIKRVLEGRRREEDYERRLNIAFDPTYGFKPSTWKGTTFYTNNQTTLRFTLVFSRVTANTLEGYFDWPEQGVRAAIQGIHDGNHIVFWDYKLIAGSGPYAKSYILKEKQAMFVSGDKMQATQGPHSEKMEATLSQ